MNNNFSSVSRSKIMSSVRSKGNKSTELRLITFFKKYRVIGWRRNVKIIGSPDFCFQRYRIVIFVDGCFWHGHNCRNLKPRTNSEYWENKIAKNIKRDSEITSILKNKGWIVIRLWECELKNDESIFGKLQPLTIAIKNLTISLEPINSVIT